MRQAIIKDNIIDNTAYKNWLKKHDSVLDEFPDIKRKIETLGSANESILARQAQLHAREKFLQTRSLTRKLQTLEKGTGPPSKILGASFNNPRLAEQLMARLKDSPEALKGYKRWVWDQAASGDSQSITNFIFDNEEFLVTLLGKEHLDNLKLIQQAKSKVELLPEFVGTGVSVNPSARLQEEFGVQPQQIASRFFAARQGRVSPKIIGAELFGRFIDAQRRKEFAVLMKQALYEPELAKILAEEGSLSALPTEKLIK